MLNAARRGLLGSSDGQAGMLLCEIELMTNKELIRRSEAVLRPYTTRDGRLFGDVGAALISGTGKVFAGVCVDTASWGLCAERSAIAAMITAGEYKIKKIVAVWRGPEDGRLYVLPPCGHCREFIRAIDNDNLDTEVLLGSSTSVKVKELIPYHEWPKPLDF